MPKSKFSNEDLSRWKREINPAPIVAARVKLSREGSEYIGTCPPDFHTSRVGHVDKTPSFKLYKLPEGVWGFKCFGCGAAGNIFQFVQEFDKITFTAAVEKVLKEAGVEGWVDGQEQDEPEVETAAKDVTNEKTFPISEYTPAIRALEASDVGKKWLAARGISMETARRFKIGFVQSAEKATKHNDWLNDGWVLFPTLSDDGQIVTAVKYRSVIAKKAKRANGKENSGILRAPHTSTTLYNMQTVKPTEDVWIAEGEPDTLVLAQAGLTAVGYPSGSYVATEAECDLLSTAKRRFLAGDNDGTGLKTRLDLEKRLSGATYAITWPNNRKDANDVLTHECGNDPEKFKALVEQLKIRATQIETEPILRNGLDIHPKRIDWMWYEKIPFGKLTLFAGNPDNGKSLASTSIAALCSNGRPFAGGDFPHTPADVLMMLGEDDLEDTAIPRLIAADADMRRIHFLEGVRPVKSEDREVKLDVDIPAIEKQLETNDKIKLIIIDPISNYLGDVSMVAEQEVRSILIPLKRMAEKYGVAVVIVMHLNKKSDLDAISRVGGAMAFIGVARCSWLFARNVEEEPAESEDGLAPAEKKPDTFSMLRIKNNLVSSSRSGLAYSVAVKDIPCDNGAPIRAPYIVWGNVIVGSADDALGSGKKSQRSEPSEPRGKGRPADKLQDAVKWLENALQDNMPYPTKVLRENAKGEALISTETLDRAFKTIGARSVKIKGQWHWQWEPLAVQAEEPEIGEDGAATEFVIG